MGAILFIQKKTNMLNIFKKYNNISSWWLKIHLFLFWRFKSLHCNILRHTPHDDSLTSDHSSDGYLNVHVHFGLKGRGSLAGIVTVQAFDNVLSQCVHPHGASLASPFPCHLTWLPWLCVMTAAICSVTLMSSLRSGWWRRGTTRTSFPMM